MARDFRELEAKMSPASRRRSRALAEKYRAEMALDELREACEMTQVHLAKILGVKAAVSKLERRTDMYVSTLQDFVKAMGGELEIIARFTEGTVEISQFGAVKKAAGGRVRWNYGGCSGAHSSKTREGGAAAGRTSPVLVR